MRQFKNKMLLLHQTNQKNKALLYPSPRKSVYVFLMIRPGENAQLNPWCQQYKSPPPPLWYFWTKNKSLWKLMIHFFLLRLVIFIGGFSISLCDMDTKIIMVIIMLPVDKIKTTRDRWSRSRMGIIIILRIINKNNKSDNFRLERRKTNY